MLIELMSTVSFPQQKGYLTRVVVRDTQIKVLWRHRESRTMPVRMPHEVVLGVVYHSFDIDVGFNATANNNSHSWYSVCPPYSDYTYPFRPLEKNMRTINTCKPAMHTIIKLSTTLKLNIRLSVLLTVLKLRFSLVRKYF